MPSLNPRAAIAGVTLVISTGLGMTYIHEGGYVNNKADRGGETIYGVTAGTAREFGYKGPMRSFPKHCDAAHPICADLVYTTNYIDKPGYRPMAEIEPAVFYELFDSAVLHGPPRASGFFQGALNGTCPDLSEKPLVADGIVGPKTIQAYKDCQWRLGKVPTCIAVLDAMDGGQKRFFDAIVRRNPSQRVFYNGWVAHRIGNVARTECKP